MGDRERKRAQFHEIYFGGFQVDAGELICGRKPTRKERQPGRRI